ncbi:MAG: DUF4190 domain-containing protein [Armatimonadota bacterium]
MQNQGSVNGTMILVFGILGFVLCPPFGLVAWSMGTNAIRHLDSLGIRESSERGLANAGRICGIISSFLWLGALLLTLMNSNAAEQKRKASGRPPFGAAYSPSMPPH